MSIERRIVKLEQHAGSVVDPDHQPGVSDQAMDQICRVAAVVETPNGLAAYLNTLEEAWSDDVVSLEDRRRADAVRAAFARTVFDEAQGL